MKQPVVRFISEPKLQPNAKGHKFMLLEDWIVYIDGVKVVIPAGFWTDFASIPRIFHSLISPLDDHLKSAIVHDYLFFTGKLFGKKISQYRADGIFYEGMKTCGTHWLKRYTMYSGVRAGAWLAWNNYRKEDKIRELKNAD